MLNYETTEIYAHITLQFTRYIPSQLRKINGIGSKSKLYFPPLQRYIYTSILTFKVGSRRIKHLVLIFDVGIHHFSVGFWGKILPEMAAASAAVKLGSLVKEEAICSTKNFLTSGESILGFDDCCFVSLLVDLGFAKPRATFGPDKLREAEPGCEPRFTQRDEPDVSSS